MIRELAQCPYCQRCEVVLDDHPEVAFNPDTTGAPCAHLVWVDGRYSQWEPGSLGINRLIGSTEFHWDHPDFGAADGEHTLTEYLGELVNSGTGWEFAPAEPFAVQPISADEKAIGPKGKAYTRWDVDGAAVFAPDPKTFVAALPVCQERRLAALRVQPDDQV